MLGGNVPFLFVRRTLGFPSGNICGKKRMGARIESSLLNCNFLIFKNKRHMVGGNCPFLCVRRTLSFPSVHIRGKKICARTLRARYESAIF